MKNKIYILFLLILIIASFLRIWKLGEVPISPDWDEVSLGYNAYSIMQTGKDEYGEKFPIVLRSFDDYKPSLYTYLAIPSVKLMGLNVQAVRLPSAIFGILTVFLTFFIVRELFKRNDLALLSSLLLAISPWHIQFSRIAFESNIGLAFNVLGIFFLLKSFKKPHFLLAAAVIFALNFYVYQSEKVFTPLIVLSFAIIFREKLFSLNKKYLTTAIIIGFLVALPMISYTLTNKNSLDRAKGVSVISQNSFAKSDADKILYDLENKDFFGAILDNRRVIFAKSIISGYLSHFDLNWLFTRGDIARHHAPNMGLLYIFELPFLLFGLYKFIFSDFDKRAKLFILFWFLLVPIPASITTGVPHAVRTLNFLPTFQIFIALGLLSAIAFIKIKVSVKTVRSLIFGILILFAGFNFSYYLNQYFVQQNFFNAMEWQYGYEKIFPELNNISKDYKKIVISNQPPMDQSYMFFLFYLKYPPDLYQSQSAYVSGGFRENHLFGKYEFRPINWQNEKRNSDTLYIGRPSDFSDSNNSLKTVYYPNGMPSMEVFK